MVTRQQQQTKIASNSIHTFVNVFQGVKAVVYDGSTRKVVSRGAQPWSILETNVPGRAEQNPSTWVEVCAMLLLLPPQHPLIDDSSGGQAAGCLVSYDPCASSAASIQT